MAVMEVTQIVGVRTRAMTMALAAAAMAKTDGKVMSAKRREEEADGGLGATEPEMSYMRLRNRSLVIRRPLSRSTRKSRRKRCESAKHERNSRCSSISSCEEFEEEKHIRLTSSRNDEKPCKNLVFSKCCMNCCHDRENSWSCNVQVAYPSAQESTVKRQLRQSAPQSSMPSISELEEFFTAVEKAEKQRFARRYNFDIDEDVPLQGRYEWVRIN